MSSTKHIDDASKSDVTSENTIDDGTQRTLHDPPSYVAKLRPGEVVANGRLEVIRKLGHGGMGAVYEVFDQQRRRRVALKTLHELDAAGIYQLKNEFRSLAEVFHPNLVSLHELFCDEQRWFFTMDLVEGEAFDHWVRPAGELDEARLRSATRQLFDALCAIHEAGKLHRDIKPSNVLVTPTGRLVVLDFGLVVHGMTGTPGRTLTTNEFQGTPRYMAPEQALGAPATRASDFHAVGVMLYEAISGLRAYPGSIADVLVAKQRDPSLRVGRVEPAIEDLIALCHALLAREPSDRPSAEQVRALLASKGSVSLPPRPSTAPSELDQVRLLGRERELSVLREAYATIRRGQTVVMAIDGESGVGKTALCHTFLREISAEEHAVVLRARCYEQESVPFKGLDPLIDELSRYLRRLRPDQAAALLPRNAFALARLFPVLSRVRAFEDAPTRTVPDSRELRRLALSAFSELLARMRDRQPLVVYLDDLQWIDADSANFLRHMLVCRDVVPLLMLTSSRQHADVGNKLLTELFESARSNPILDLRKLTVSPLTASDTIELAQHVLGDVPGARAASATIAHEAGGNPYFAQELARAAREGSAAPELGVAELIARRTADLSEPGRALLQMLALAGCPMPVKLLLEAAGADHADVDALRAVHMVRGSAGVADARIECYHDRLRDVVAAALDAARRTELYRALAGALSCRDSPELLSRCQEAIGDLVGAAESAVHAARRAATALAFERAVVHYRRALEWGREDAVERPALLLELAESLENAGYGREAAVTFESLALRAEGEMRLDYQRRAALQLLETGHLDKGLELLEAVCRSVGLDLPGNDATAFLTYQFISLQLRVSSSKRSTGQPSPKQKLVLRTARAAVTGVVNHLQLIATSIAAQYLREALRSGDTGDCVRALGFQAHMTTMVEPASVQAREALDRMQQLATDSMDNELLGFASMMQGTTAYHREEMRTARDHLSRAKTWLTECRGVEWEHDATNCYDLMSACYAGDYLDIARTTPLRLDEALRRGRVWAATMLTGFAGMPAWLSADDVDGYRDSLAEVYRLQEQGEHRNWQRLVLLYAEGLLHLYVGEPQRGFEHFAKGHARYKRSLFARRTAMGALGYATHRGRCAASALQLTAAAGRSRRELLEGLSESIAVMVSRGRSRSRALAALLTAARSWNSDAPERALDELQAALPLLERAGLRMHLAAARKRLGEHLGGDTGRELLMAAEDAMRAQGIRNIEAMTELNCPGLRS